MDSRSIRSVVLVLDDDPAVRSTLAELVGGEFDLRCAATPAELERACGGSTIDVALVDHHLGAGQPTGLDVLLQLGQRWPDCARVLFSADLDQSLLLEAINRGHVDAFLAKPARRDQLLATLRHSADTARLRRDNRALVGQLAERNRRLEESTVSLEESVRERTAHLEELSKRLQEKHHELVRLETISTVGHLVRGLAHELNNPLAAILGYAQRLQRGVSRPEEASHKLEVIVTEVDRCRTLVDQLRKLAAPLDEALVPCAPAVLLRESAARLAELGRPVPHLDIPDELPEVQGGARSLTRVFDQILDNAAQAGARSISLSTSSISGRVQLILDNDGETPDAATVANAIKPFFTTRSRTGGRGLGLTIAAALLKEQGGTLMLDRRPNESGARIVITLPPAPTTGRHQALSRPRGLPRVLVVDDEPLIAELLSDCLTEAGCEVRVAATVADAWQVVNDGLPLRAILADVHLGDGSGIDLLHRAEGARATLAGHLALVTGDGQATELDRQARASGYPILAKPFRLEQMVDFVARML
jgi:signal transduction histidine kinase